jgi:hypothetical protein
MLVAMLKPEIEAARIPAKPLPKRIPNTYAVPDVYSTNAVGSAVAPLAFAHNVIPHQVTEFSRPITQGGLIFKSGAVTTHSNIGFTPFLDKNIRELKSPLPLTIFDKDWQERALTWHVEKRPKADDSGSEKNPRYTGLPYHSEWSQTYATWTMNHRTFNDLLRNVYDLEIFADWMVIHKSHVDNLHKHHGFMPAFRYDIMTRANTFSHRV